MTLTTEAAIYLHGERIDEDRLQTIFRHIANRRLVPWREKAALSRESADWGMRQQAERFERCAVEQDQDVVVTVVQWLELVKTELGLSDEIVRIGP